MLDLVKKYCEESTKDVDEKLILTTAIKTIEDQLVATFGNPMPTSIEEDKDKLKENLSWN